MSHEVIGGRERYLPIADYAVVGDCHTAALIARDGSVDWYCPTRFDGPAVFCRLLDADRGGFFGLAPTGRFSSERRYRGATNVLETTFAAAGGRVRLTDFMPIHDRTPSSRGYDVGTSRRIVRLVEGLGGEVELELRFRPTFDYARASTDLRAAADGGAVATADGQFLALAAPGVALDADGDGGLRGRLRLRGGERRWLILSDVDDAERAREALAAADSDDELAGTIRYWEDWAALCDYRGPYRSEVLRSALVLKLLTYDPTGAIVAAPTTSLPEEIGGERNWDYRYTWLRDSAFILYALMTVGYQAAAADFFDWLGEACRLDPTTDPQIMYAVDARREIPERTLDHLEGYCGSRPVRIGNAAAGQRQLDIYGEVLRAAYLRYRGAEGAAERPAVAPWTLLRGLIERAAEQWCGPDRGIWEVRGEPRHFLHSKLMCWSALDRGIRLAEEHRLEAPLDRWRRTRDAIRRAILERGYNAARGAFTQSFGGAALDASALAIPRVGFLPPTDPRVRMTIERIRAELSHDGMIYRYLSEDGLRGSEGTFALCSFWLVDALALGGRLDEAHALFERLVGYANDVGLLAEEIDPGTGVLLGNFPQGLTHLGLIGSAVNLAKAAKHGAEEEAENEGDRAAPARRASTEGRSARAPVGGGDP